MQKHQIEVKSILAPLLPSFTSSVFLPLHPSEEIITMMKTKAWQVAGSKWEVSCLGHTHKFRQTEVVGGCKMIEPERRNQGNICGGGEDKKKIICWGNEDVASSQAGWWMLSRGVTSGCSEVGSRSSRLHQLSDSFRSSQGGNCLKDFPPPSFSCL